MESVSKVRTGVYGYQTTPFLTHPHPPDIRPQFSDLFQEISRSQHHATVTPPPAHYKSYWSDQQNGNVSRGRESALKVLNTPSGAQFVALPLVKPIFLFARAVVTAVTSCRSAIGEANFFICTRRRHCCHVVSLLNLLISQFDSKLDDSKVMVSVDISVNIWKYNLNQSLSKNDPSTNCFRVLVAINVNDVLLLTFGTQGVIIVMIIRLIQPQNGNVS